MVAGRTREWSLFNMRDNSVFDQNLLLDIYTDYDSGGVPDYNSTAYADYTKPTSTLCASYSNLIISAANWSTLYQTGTAEQYAQVFNDNGGSHYVFTFNGTAPQNQYIFGYVVWVYRSATYPYTYSTTPGGTAVVLYYYDLPDPIEATDTKGDHWDIDLRIKF